MKLPYIKSDLQFALFGVDKKKFTKEKFRELEEESRDMINKISEKADLNKAVAEYQGITVEQLINSPNYQILYDEYALSLLERVVNKIVEKFEITEKQAWALMTKSTGLLD